MSAIIRSWVTQYRLIIEDEVQAGRQALTYALNSRRDSLGGFPVPLSFYYFLVSPATRAHFDPRVANASLLFQSLSMTVRPPTAAETTFQFV